MGGWVGESIGKMLKIKQHNRSELSAEELLFDFIHKLQMEPRYNSNGEHKVHQVNAHAYHITPPTFQRMMLL